MHLLTAGRRRGAAWSCHDRHFLRCDLPEPWADEHSRTHVLWFLLKPGHIGLGISRQRICNIVGGERVELFDTNEREMVCPS